MTVEAAKTTTNKKTKAKGGREEVPSGSSPGTNEPDSALQLGRATKTVSSRLVPIGTTAQRARERDFSVFTSSFDGSKHARRLKKRRKRGDKTSTEGQGKIAVCIERTKRRELPQTAARACVAVFVMDITRKQLGKETSAGDKRREPCRRRWTRGGERGVEHTNEVTKSEAKKHTNYDGWQQANPRRERERKRS